MRTAEQQARYAATRRAKAAAKAVAEGRDPRRVGAPPRLTPQQKEASRIAQNKKRSARSLAKRTAARAARAFAEGRVPGQAGQPSLFTPEQQKANRREWEHAHRQKNLAARRAYEAEWQRQKRADKATAEGRIPGTIGHKNTMTAAELAAYMRDWSDDDKRFYFRAKTANLRARKLGCVGEITVADCRRCAEEQQRICAFCGREFGDAIPELDHWIPLAGGGTNTPDNIKLLHRGCNRTKGKRHPAEFGLPSSLPSERIAS